jgi:hypothetical protein
MQESFLASPRIGRELQTGRQRHDAGFRYRVIMRPQSGEAAGTLRRDNARVLSVDNIDSLQSAVSELNKIASKTK